MLRPRKSPPSLPTVWLRPRESPFLWPRILLSETKSRNSRAASLYLNAKKVSKGRYFQILFVFCLPFVYLLILGNCPGENMFSFGCCPYYLPSPSPWFRQVEKPKTQTGNAQTLEKGLPLQPNKQFRVHNIGFFEGVDSFYCVLPFSWQSFYQVIQPARAPKDLRTESARAVTGRRCPHSGKGEKTFWRVNRVFFTKTAVTRERKVEKSLPRWEVNSPSKGYKRVVDQKWGGMA